jgi:hypothetical protein
MVATHKQDDRGPITNGIVMAAELLLNFSHVV